ncbi:MAG: hypothetical protein U5N10_17430 [Gemmobacter sp.]|nr:hypothetical protein [Gemmobacter sp.]
MRDGKKASASATFERRAAAEAWLRRKEVDVAKPGGFEKISQARMSGVTLGDAIDQYIAHSEKEMGKTKAQVLRAIKGHGIADRAAPAPGTSECGRSRNSEPSP